MKWWHVALPTAGLAAGLWALHNAPEPAKPASGPKPPPAPPGPAPSGAAAAPASAPGKVAPPPTSSAPKGKAPSSAPAPAPGAGLPPGFTPPPGASAARGLETLGKPGGAPGPSILDSLLPGSPAPAPTTGPGSDVPAVVLPEKKEGKDGEVVAISETTTGPTLADKLADAGIAALPSAWSGIVPGEKPSGADGAS